MSLQTGDIVRIVATLLWTDGNVMQNVFNAVLTGAGGPWDESDIIDDALDWLQNMYATITTVVSDTVDGSAVTGYVYDAIDDDWDEFESDNWTFNPSNATGELPRGAAGLLNAKTTDPDVSGKKYLGGFAEGSLALGLWGAATVADMVDFGGEWVIPFVGVVSGADWTPGIWSPTRTVFLPSSLVVVIPTIPAYQRRRKRGVGI